MASKVHKLVVKKSKRRRVIKSDKSALRQFGIKLRNWMDRSGHTAEVLATMSRTDFDGTITEPRLSRILHHKGSSPTLETATKYAQLFGLTLEEFYAEREATALERTEEFKEFRNLLAMGDTEAIEDVMKAIRYAMGDAQRRVQAKARDRPELKQQSGPEG